MSRVLHYEKVEGRLIVNRPNIDLYYRQWYYKAFWKGKFAYVSEPDDKKAANKFSYACWPRLSQEYNTDQIVFVSHSSKISRDALRKSGYTLTHTRENANTIIIPATPKIIYNSICKYIVVDGGVMYLYSADRYDIRCPEELIDFIQNLHPDCEVIKAANDNFLKVEYLPKCQEYEDILTNVLNYDFKVRIYEDTDVLIDGGVEMSIEAMESWKRMDQKLREKSMLLSNCQKYPLTTCLFIRWHASISAYTSDKAFQCLLSSIGYPSFGDNGTIGNNILITNDDYQLAVKWILHECGADENCRYITPYAFFHNIPHYAENLLRAKVVIGNITFEDPIPFAELSQTIKNLNN